MFIDCDTHIFTARWGKATHRPAPDYWGNSRLIDINGLAGQFFTKTLIICHFGLIYESNSVLF